MTKKLTEYIITQQFDDIDKLIISECNIETYKNSPVLKYGILESLGIFSGCKEITEYLFNKLKENIGKQELSIDITHLKAENKFFNFCFLHIKYDDKYENGEAGYYSSDGHDDYNEVRYDTINEKFKFIEINLIFSKEHIYNIYSLIMHELVHAYEEWGASFIKKLRGMFAFCIYDTESHKLMLARDHFGIKPVYYYNQDDLFLFGSEIKSFLAHPEFKKELNKEMLGAYLTFSFTPGEKTFFKNVYKLKEYIRNYSKYLGLDPTEVADEFNDFLFEHTSKISLEDILEAKKKIEEKEENKIKSPYTKEYKQKKDYRQFIYILGGVILIAIIVYLIIALLEKETVHNEVLLENKEEIYEFTY